MNSGGVYVLSKRAVTGFTCLDMEKDIFDEDIRAWIVASLIEIMATEVEKQPDTKKMTESLVGLFKAELDTALEKFKADKLQNP